ncbi:glycosyltransferase family 2 protein [Mesorhizobium sp. ANAO-SY3R2]|uniref:glycosyltransferase family 2 protein n=1 Tax=Mesorhizobium sp. ANAO-SY3R2 TaxID=3166644 RepID=UPI0036722B39
MKLSIIVPVYNRERYVGSTLRSILRQRDDADLDIIVIDDGSSDGSADIVRAFINEGAPIRLYSQPNAGVTKARNTGLRRLPADAEFVSFVDSDDISPVGRFAADLAFFKADPSLELTYSFMRMVDQIDDDSLEPVAGCDDRIFRGVHLSAGIYRRSLVDRIGEFDEDLAQAEDTDFLFRVFEQRARYVFPDTIAIYYRRHDHSLTKNIAEARKEFLKAMQKSMKRRKADPTLGDLRGFIQITHPSANTAPSSP